MDRRRRPIHSVKIASIDIGTNTVLLLIAEIGPDGVIHALHHEQRLPRLGRGVDRRRRIARPVFDLIGEIIEEYAGVSRQFGCETIAACATSAVRDAANRDEFLQYLRGKTGINVDVVSGEEEAVLTYRGAVSGLSGEKIEAAVLDIGGGSTEISWQRGAQAEPGANLHRLSFDVGSVRLKERFLRNDPPLRAELVAARSFVKDHSQGLEGKSLEGLTLVGVAGTVTTLACLDQHLPEFDLSRVSGYLLGRSAVESWLNRLSRITASEIRSLSTATEGRADILTAGVLILLEFMTMFDFDRVRVSERGLRYGLALREFERLRGASR